MVACAIMIIVMKIAVFTDIYAPWGDGGVAASIKAQKDELERLGHEVVVFCPGFQAKEKNVITVPSHKYLRINGAVIAKRPPVVEEFVLGRFPDFGEFDLVHVHYEGPCSIAGVNLAKKFNLPLVQTMHGREDMAIAINVPHPFKLLTATALDVMHGKYLPHSEKVRRDKFQAPTRTRARMWDLMVNQADRADLVIAPSTHFARKLEHYGVSQPIWVVSNGVPADLVSLDFKERELQDGDVLKLVWNSRLSKEKRIMPFLRAIAQLKRPYLVSIYGDGNQMRKAEKFAKKHRLKVKFYGRRKREQIVKKMAEAHLAVMASYNFDTQGLTLLEAEAMGLPVFFCDPEMIEVVPEGSFLLAGGPEAEAMAITLENFPVEKVQQMSKRMMKNREQVLQPKQIGKLEKAYREAIQLKKKSSQTKAQR